MLDSVASIHARYGDWLYRIEWAFTLLFSIEYALRLWCIQHTWAYARSFYGLVDLVGIIPTYLSLWLAGSQYFLVVRVIRVLRVFRVLRMVRYVGEAELIAEALLASRRKITVFVASIVALVVIFGSAMFLIEGGSNPNFASIPDSVYWGRDDHDNGRIWRYHAVNDPGAYSGNPDYDHGLWNYCGAHRHCDAGIK